MTAPEIASISRVFAPEAVGTTVRVRGWVRNSRSSGGILFLLLRDRSGTVQVTGKKDTLGAEAFDAAEHVQVEGAIEVEGTVANDPRAPGGREVRASTITIHDARTSVPDLPGTDRGVPPR